MIRTARVALGLGAVYLLTLASSDPADLATGVLLGVVLAAALGRRLLLAPGGPRPGLARRALGVPVFAAGMLADVAAGTWDVLLRVVHLSPVDRPGIVRVPIGERTDRGVAVSALATTLSPGTVLVDVDWERREMLLHVMDASDPDGVRAKLARFYERYQRQVFP